MSIIRLIQQSDYINTQKFWRIKFRRKYFRTLFANFGRIIFGQIL